MAPRRRRRSSSARRADEMTNEPMLSNTGRCNSCTNIDNSMDVDEPQLFIKTSDSKKFVLLKSQASCFNALHIITKEYTTNTGNNFTGDLIHLNTVHSRELGKVLEWTELYCSKSHFYYDNDELGHGRGTWTGNQPQNLSDSEKAFVASMKEEEMLRVMHVANYLDVRCLLAVCCKTIGKCWEGKQVEDLRKIYGIQSDFSADEEAAMKAETKRLGLQ